MNNKDTQYELLMKDRYHAIPLNITHPTGHHVILEFNKTCHYTIKKNKK